MQKHLTRKKQSLKKCVFKRKGGFLPSVAWGKVKEANLWIQTGFRDVNDQI